MKKIKNVRPCRECGEPMRTQDANPDEFPGSVVHRAKGLCDKCYSDARRAESTVPVAPADPEAIRPGFNENQARADLHAWLDERNATMTRITTHPTGKIKVRKHPVSGMWELSRGRIVVGAAPTQSTAIQQAEMITRQDRHLATRRAL